MLTSYAGLAPARRSEECANIRLGLRWLYRRVFHDGAEYPQRKVLAEAVRSGALGEQLVVALEAETDPTVREVIWDIFAVIPRPRSADKLRALAARETQNEAKSEADAALAALH
jgi:hypothetical protein